MVASQISRARYKSITPDSSAAPVPGSRHPKSTASPAHQDAPYRDMVSSSATSAAADAGIRAGRPSGPVPMSSSRAADRDAICATAASSLACAHDARRRHAPAVAARSASPSSAAGISDSHAARSGPGASFSATRPASTPAGTSSPGTPSSSRSSGTTSRAPSPGFRPTPGCAPGPDAPSEPEPAEAGPAKAGPAGAGLAGAGLRPAPDGSAPGPVGSCGPGSLRLSISAAKSSSQDHDRACGVPAPSVSSSTGSPPPLTGNRATGPRRLL